MDVTCGNLNICTNLISKFKQTVNMYRVTVDVSIRISHFLSSQTDHKLACSSEFFTSKICSWIKNQGKLYNHRKIM